MTKTIPNYLRVHRGQSKSNSVKNDSSHGTAARVTVAQFWQTYSEVTGWRIDQVTPADGTDCKILPVVNTDTTTNPDELDAAPIVAKSMAERLANSASSLAQQLQQARDALRRQSAELSSRAAIIQGDDSRDRLATAIESTLCDVATATDCQAAQLFLLDDDTKTLATRGAYGLPESRMSELPRDLKGSRGDLEAMVQGLVAINDLNETTIDTWNCPETAASAICVSVVNADVPIGTLWIYSTEKTEFTSAHLAAAKIAAANIGLHLQQAATLKRPAEKKPSQGIGQVANWQMASLPIGTQLAPGWRVDGMLESNQAWATGWHNWDVLPDGTMMIAIAEAEESSAAAAMTATVARAALTAHTGYRHTPRQVLQRISDTLWQTSTYDQLTSLLYAHIDPETGEGDLATAGSITAMIASRHGYRPIVRETAMPLASHIDASCISSTFRMIPGEVFFAGTRGLELDGASQMMLGNRLRESMQNLDASPLSSIRRSMANLPLKNERGAISILRQ